MDELEQDKSSIAYIFDIHQPDTVEFRSGLIFTPLQLVAIKDLLLVYVELKLHLKYDSSDISRSIQEEAELTGQIGILKYLLEQHEAASEVILPEPVT